jgi:glycolate oxidase
MLDGNTIKVLRERAGMKLPDAMAMILVEMDAFTHAESDFQIDKVVEVFRKNNAIRIQTAKSSGEAEELWRACRTAGSMAGQLRPNNV